MNTFDLFKFLTNDSLCNRYFLGIFARDELPNKINKYPCSFIINTEPRHKPGKHWLAIFFNENRNLEFFDPMGMPPSYYLLDDYFEKMSSNKYKWNKIRIQSLFSNLCGHICLFYLFFKSRHHTLEYIQSNFSSDYQKNEKMILDFLKL